MALFEAHLVVKPSTIPGSGQGLFTKIFLPKATRIVEYKGRITSWEKVKHDSENGYFFVVNQNHVIDGRPFKKSLARYANDARGLQRVKGLKNNCVFVKEGLRVYLESVKDIEAGQELLVDYGKEYWQVVQANLKIDEQG